VQFDSSNNTLRLVKGTGPTSNIGVRPGISHTVADLTDYTVGYNFLSKTLYVRKGADLTPLDSWVDTLDTVPHGPGYRYAGFSFDTGFLFSPGVEVAGWQAKDN
jgi:hypothetical protein